MKSGLLALAIALCTQLIQSQLLSFPMNTIANTGQRVEFECSTNVALPLIWDFAEVNSTRFEFIYFNEAITNKFSSRYKVNSSMKGRWALVIDSVDFAHAGKYRCQNTPNYDQKERTTNASAQLVVIDSDPLFGTNASTGGIVEGDYIKIWCTFNYSGNLLPVMEWTRNNGQTVEANVHCSYESSKVTSSLAKQLASSDNAVTFAWKMIVRPNTTNGRYIKEGDTQATNIPHFQRSWNYTANVLYGPRNQIILLVDDALKVGSRMKCFAEGNPTPSYEWELVGKNISLSSGSVIEISESMVSSEEQTLRCTAMNSVAGQIRSIETSFTFNLTATTQSNGSNFLTFQTILIIVSSIGALILCLAIAVIIYKIRRIGDAKSPEAPVQPIYGIVKKDKNACQGDVTNAADMPTNHSHRQPEIPVYGEVKKNNGKKKPGPTFKISSPTKKQPKQDFTGADGTLYAEMNSFTDQKFNGVPVKHNPMFSMVEIYASIDHTMAVPPPTPPPVPERH